MSPHELAARLVALRQHGFSEQYADARKSLHQAFRDDVVVWAAWLQTQPETLEGLLHLLVSEIALERQEQGLPVPPIPDAPTTPADAVVEILGAAAVPADLARLDRLAAGLAAFRDWTIEVVLDDGERITVRPPREEAA